MSAPTTVCQMNPIISKGRARDGKLHTLDIEWEIDDIETVLSHTNLSSGKLWFSGSWKSFYISYRGEEIYLHTRSILINHKIIGGNFRRNCRRWMEKRETQIEVWCGFGFGSVLQLRFLDKFCNIETNNKIMVTWMSNNPQLNSNHSSVNANDMLFSFRVQFEMYRIRSLHNYNYLQLLRFKLPSLQTAAGIYWRGLEAWRKLPRSFSFTPFKISFFEEKKSSTLGRKKFIVKSGKLMATPKPEREGEISLWKNITIISFPVSNDVMGWTERDKSMRSTTEKIFLSLCLWRFSVSQKKTFSPFLCNFHLRGAGKIVKNVGRIFFRTFFQKNQRKSVSRIGKLFFKKITEKRVENWVKRNSSSL